MQAPPVAARILIVDDDAMSRDLLALLLEAEGHDVRTADSGDAALALLRELPSLPQAVLTDLHMPGIATEQLAKALRHACGNSCRLIAISGSQPTPSLLTLFDGFLLKPFSAAQVGAAVSAPPPAASPNAVDADTPPKATHGGQPQQQPMRAILNDTIFSQLAGTLPAAQLQQMYAMCLSDARRRIESMRASASAGDSAAFIREAHAVKGGCGMLGATELHRLAADFESHGIPSSPDVNSLDELSAACDRLERMLGSRA